jgi:hypothetical protein
MREASIGGKGRNVSGSDGDLRLVMAAIDGLSVMAYW